MAKESSKQWIPRNEEVTKNYEYLQRRAQSLKDVEISGVFPGLTFTYRGPVGRQVFRVIVRSSGKFISASDPNKVEYTADQILKTMAEFFNLGEVAALSEAAMEEMKKTPLPVSTDLPKYGGLSPIKIYKGKDENDPSQWAYIFKIDMKEKTATVGYTRSNGTFTTRDLKIHTFPKYGDWLMINSTWVDMANDLVDISEISAS